MTNEARTYLIPSILFDLVGSVSSSINLNSGRLKITIAKAKHVKTKKIEKYKSIFKPYGYLYRNNWKALPEPEAILALLLIIVEMMYLI